MRILRLFGMLTILFLFIQPSASAKRWALLVGINDYEHPLIRKLRGCENDVKLLSDVLRERFEFTNEDMRILLSQEATRDAIITAFKEWLIEKPKPGDLVIFYFSGHGGQVIDESGDEADGWDELLCPVNLKPTSDRTRYVNPILDDELSELLSQIPTDNVTVILDSCHSGTGTKSLINAGLTLPKMIARDLLLVPQKPADRPSTQRESISIEQTTENHVLISGSRADEVSLDAMWEDASYGGVLTRNLVEALRQATSKTSYVDLMQRVRESVRKRSHQSPQLEGDANRPIFSTRNPGGTFSYVVAPSKPFLLVTQIEEDRMTLNAGSILGVTQGSVYDVFSPTEASFTGEPLATMRITSVDRNQSSGEILESRFTIQPMCRAVESSHAHPPDKLYLRVQFEGDTTQLASLKKTFSEIPDLVIVESGYADVVLEVQTKDYRLFGRLTAGDGTMIGQATATSASQFAEQLKPNLNNAFVKKWLINLKNPNPPFKISVWMDKGDDPIYQIDEVAIFKFRSERKCYLTLLNVDTQGHITMLFPNKYHPNNQIVANVTYTIPSPDMKFRIHAQGPPGRELLKAVATTTPIPLPELDLDKISQTQDSFLRVRTDEVLSLTKGLGMLFRNKAFVVVEKADHPPEQGGGSPDVTHLPTSKFVTSEFIAEIRE